LLFIHRRRIQKVREPNLQAIAHIHPQHYWARPLALSELNVPWDQPFGRINRNHISLESKYHPLRLNCAEPIPEEGLIQRHNVCRDYAIASGNCRRILRLRALRRKRDRNHPK
jgi:hypothetical protein